MGRWIGVDYGARRIGLAVSDPGHSFASPADTIPARGQAGSDAQCILRWADEHEPHGFVVGLPLNMDGTEGPQAEVARTLAGELSRRTPLPVRLWDERLTTFHADQLMRAAGVRRARQRRLRDALAAQAILQEFLDAQRADA